MRRKKLSVMFLVSLLFGTGCFNKNNPLSEEETPPSIPQLIIFRGPSSPNAPEELNSGIGLFNVNTTTGFNYLSLANLISPEADGNTFIWQVSYGQFSALIEARKRSNGTVDWTLTLDGSDDTITYEKWVVMRGNSFLDGSKGMWNIFAENSTVEVAEVSWEVNENNVRSGALDLANLSRLYELINHPNNSGSIAIKETDEKVYEATWDESGAGSWTAWDAQGNLVGSGNWN